MPLRNWLVSFRNCTSGSLRNSSRNFHVFLRQGLLYKFLLEKCGNFSRDSLRISFKFLSLVLPIMFFFKYSFRNSKRYILSALEICSGIDIGFSLKIPASICQVITFPPSISPKISTAFALWIILRFYPRILQFFLRLLQECNWSFLQKLLQRFIQNISRKFKRTFSIEFKKNSKNFWKTPTEIPLLILLRVLLCFKK